MGYREKLFDSVLLSMRGSASVVFPVWAMSPDVLWKRQVSMERGKAGGCH